MTAYLGLFGVSFLAATLIPFYSEVALVGLLAAGYDPWLLWLFASAGNTLGAVVNWVLGRYLIHFEHKRWFPFPSSNLHRYQRWYQHFGVWSLLLSWLPVGGRCLNFYRRCYESSTRYLFNPGRIGQKLALRCHHLIIRPDFLMVRHSDTGFIDCHDPSY